MAKKKRSKFNRFIKKSQRAKRKVAGHSHQPLLFPKGFLWGTSTSSHQVEGNNTNNDWWAWEHGRGKKRVAEPSGAAANQYELYENDFDIIADMHNNAHRLSIEWSRIEPEEGQWNWIEVEHYRKVLQALKKRNIKVMLTLHHFTNPIWLAKQGGWEQRRTAELFARYAEFIAEHLGEYVDFWITINEPLVYVSESYMLGKWPPAKKSIWKTAKVFFTMARAHRLAYREIHAEMHKQHRIARVGIAKNVVSLVSYRKKFIDYVYVRVSEYVWNNFFFSRTRGTHDYLGVNYYFHNRVKRDKGGKLVFVDVRQEDRDRSDLGWEIYAPGLFDVLLELQRYGLPIYITENGLAAINDHKRTRFIVAHVKELYHAIKAGMDVRGYFHWSLLDNYEWDKGFEPRFGLIAVDYETQKRTIRPSARVYARICEENAITHEILRYLGHGAHEEDS